MKKASFKNKVFKKNKITILLISAFFSISILTAQEIPKVNVLLKLKIIDGDLKNSQITITKTGEPYKVINPDNEGDILDLPLGFEYTFKYTKTGYNTKVVIFDTHVPENREKKMFITQISEVELEKISGKLEDNYLQVVGKITYSIKEGDFDFVKSPAVKENKAPKNESIPTASPNKQVSPFDKPPENKSETVSSISDGKKNKVVKTVQEDYKKFTIITITIDGVEIVYKKEEYGWGMFFYKDGKRITETTFLSETE